MKKILALFLSVSMLLCSFSAAAFADEQIDLPPDEFEEDEHYFALDADEELGISAYIGELPYYEAVEMTADGDGIFPGEEFTLTFKTDDPDCWFSGMMDCYYEDESGEWVRHWFREGTHGISVDEYGDLHYTVTAEMQQTDHFFMPATGQTIFDGEMIVYDMPEGWGFLNNGTEPEVIFSEEWLTAVPYGDGIKLTFLDFTGDLAYPYAVKCDVDYGPDGEPTYSCIKCSSPASEYYDEEFAQTHEFTFDAHGLNAHIYPFFTETEFDFAMFDQGEDNITVDIEMGNLGHIDIEYLKEYSDYVSSWGIYRFAVDKEKDSFSFVLSPTSDRISWIDANGAGYDRPYALEEGILSIIWDEQTGASYQKVTVPLNGENTWVFIDFEHNDHGTYRGFNIGYDDGAFTMMMLMPGEEEYTEWYGGLPFPDDYEETDKYCIKLVPRDPERSIFAVERNDNNTGATSVFQPEYYEGEEPCYYFEIPASDFENDLYYEIREERVPLAGEMTFNFTGGGGVNVYNEAEGPEHPIDPWDQENNCDRIFTYTGDFNICAADWNDPQSPRGIFAAEVRLNNGECYLFCSGSTYAEDHNMIYLEEMGSGKLSLSAELLKGEGVRVRLWFDEGSYRCDMMSPDIGQRMVEFGIEDGDGMLAFMGANEDIFDYASKDDGSWQKVLIDEDRRSCEILIAEGSAYAYEVNGRYIELEAGQQILNIELDPYSNHTNVRVFFNRAPKYWVDWTEGDIEVRADSIDGPVLDRCCELKMAGENTVIAIIPGQDVLFRGLNIQENDGILTSVPVSELTKVEYADGFYYTYQVPYNPDNEAPARIWAFTGQQPLCGEFLFGNNDNDGTVKLNGEEIRSFIDDVQQIHQYEGDNLVLTYESKSEGITKPFAIRANGLCMEDIYYVGDEVPEGGITIPAEGRGVWLNIWWNEDQFYFDETHPFENEREIFIRTGGIDYYNAHVSIPELDEIAARKAVFGDAVKYIIPDGYAEVSFTVTSYNCSFRGIHINGTDINTEAPYPMSYRFTDIDMSDNVNIHIDVCRDDAQAEVIGTVADYGLVVGYDFSLNFGAVFMPNRSEDMYLEVSRGDEVLSRIPAVARGNDEFGFRFTNIGAQHMTDIYTLKLVYFDGEKDVVLDTREASVQNYINDIYTQNNSEEGDHDDNLNQLLRDVIEYGAWAQRYSGYKTDDLADAIWWKDSIAPGEFAALTEADTVKNRTATAEPGTRITGVALGLGEAVNIIPVVKTANAEDLFIKATALGETKYYKVAEYGGNGIYNVILDPTPFALLDAVYTLELVRGYTVLQTVTYSVNSYVYSWQDAETELGYLVKTIYCLGISSKAYLQDQ